MQKVDKLLSSSFDEFVESIFQKPTKTELDNSNLPLTNVGDYIEIYKEKKELENQINRLKKAVLEKSLHNKNLQKEVSALKVKRKELEVEKSKADLSNQNKSSFLANMSHEIRTPMNGVIGMANVLQQTKLTDTQQEYLDIINTSASSLLSLINDILDYSKIEAGELTLENIFFKLDDVLKQVFDIFRFRAGGKGLDLDIQIHPAIPSCLKGDPVRLRQVLINLVANAIKFTESGKVTIRVQIASESETDLILRFQVTDTGIGISEEQKKKLFKSFSQADTSITRKYGGTGLGLTISKELSRLMDGKIGVKSRKGKGSTFWFTARFEKTANENNTETNSSRTFRFQAIKNNDSRSKPKRNLSLLLVEDDIINQKVTRIILENEGYIVDIAENGEKAVRLLKNNQYDLVLMDIEMPGMNGYQATQKIRSQKTDILNPTIPIIAMTAHAMTGDREKCLSAGMDDYVSKPINTKILNKKIEQKLLASSCSDSKNKSLKKQKRNSDASIDIDKLALLHKEVGDDFGLLINVFLDHLPEKLDRMYKALVDKNRNQLGNAAHQLKGSSATFYAEKMVAICEHLEKSTKDDQVEMIILNKLLLQLQTEATQVDAILRKEIE